MKHKYQLYWVSLLNVQTEDFYAWTETKNTYKAVPVFGLTKATAANIKGSVLIRACNRGEAIKTALRKYKTGEVMEAYYKD